MLIKKHKSFWVSLRPAHPRETPPKVGSISEWKKGSKKGYPFVIQYPASIKGSAQQALSEAHLRRRLIRTIFFIEISKLLAKTTLSKNDHFWSSIDHFQTKEGGRW